MPVMTLDDHGGEADARGTKHALALVATSLVTPGLQARLSIPFAPPQRLRAEAEEGTRRGNSYRAEVANLSAQVQASRAGAGAPGRSANC